MSKALSQVQLDQPLTAEIATDCLRIFAALVRSTSSGSIAARPGADSTTRDGSPLALHDLVAGIPGFYVQTDWSSQPTMMQVAGGMDRLPAALAARLGNRIVYRAAVREIGQSEKGVWVVYADADGRHNAPMPTTASPPSRYRC